MSGAREVGTGAKDMPSDCRAHAKGRPLTKSLSFRYRPIAASGEFWKQTFAAQAEN
jgi:hypothetical protein